MDELIGAALIGVVVLVGFVAFNLLGNDDSMTLYYYPEAPSLSTLQEHEVDSLEECRDLAESLSVRDDRPDYDYECGVNCKPSDYGSVNICDKTLE